MCTSSSSYSSLQQGSNARAIFYELRNEKDKCVDLYGSLTTNGNPIQLAPCSGASSQKWWIDTNYYIRSGVDTSKVRSTALLQANSLTDILINIVFPFT